jgi:DNA invertase Pin-like site-specific DNA recombinase
MTVKLTDAQLVMLSAAAQREDHWRLAREHYDDGGYSGGSMDRPALLKLLADVQGRRIDVIVAYNVDRLTRSLADFAKLVELFDKHEVSFVSVTQAFNTTTGMGRLTPRPVSTGGQRKSAPLSIEMSRPAK